MRKQSWRDVGILVKAISHALYEFSEKVELKSNELIHIPEIFNSDILGLHEKK